MRKHPPPIGGLTRAPAVVADAPKSKDVPATPPIGGSPVVRTPAVVADAPNSKDVPATPPIGGLPVVRAPASSAKPAAPPALDPEEQLAKLRAQFGEPCTDEPQPPTLVAAGAEQREALRATRDVEPTPAPTPTPPPTPKGAKSK
jgi:hypothetical protein